MTLQRDIFLGGEGQRWLERNANSLERKTPGDAVIELVRGIKPASVLEIGCSNGWRLKKLVGQGLCQQAIGVDPSVPGRIQGEVSMYQGTAELMPLALSYEDFDCIIFGFCLYLCDPKHYFQIVWQADKKLKDGGYLIIHDFRHGPYEAAHRKIYEHCEGVYSHHADFSRLWAGHPAYRQSWTYVHEYGGVKIPKDEMITMFHKDMRGAFGDA